ncbi:MAG: universal stress protein [Polaromonas sp.]|nr:universal stress protein [Polaromonas sp.]
MYRRILVAVDGSSTSTKAVLAAVELASYSGGRSEIRLIHVLDEMTYFTGLSPYAGESGAVIAAMQEAGRKILADALAIVQSAGIRADTVLIDQFGTHLAEAVAAQARQWDASLTVVGTHGRRGIGRMLLGSGAEQIIRLAPGPVLVVRGAESGDAVQGSRSEA